MNKYILLMGLSILINNSYAQLIIGDLQIEGTNNPYQIKITNISSKPIDKIILNGHILPNNMRVLKPNESRLFIFNKSTIKDQEKARKEQEALMDLINQ